MTLPTNRPKAKTAAPALLVLARMEAVCGELLARSPRWPKRARFTLTQRIENLALDCVELLLQARYERAHRERRLRELNLHLERMRHLMRLGRTAQVIPARHVETLIRGMDEVGRMAHGWRKALP